ncbi:MAG: CopG family transcriptional regulator [Burkholderiales bacterium]|nr:CopG family transcriptional regulator [Burkholderiales bacterium]
MGQVTIYLDGESEKRMKQAAKAAGMPMSRWLAQLVQEKTRSEWPESVRAAAGAWSDFPSAEALRKGAGKDTKREAL